MSQRFFFGIYAYVITDTNLRQTQRETKCNENFEKRPGVVV